MIAVNYTNLRENLKDYCDKANDDLETIIVARKNQRNVVIMSEEQYNNMAENDFIRSNTNNYQRILKAKAQIESGEGEIHKLYQEA